MYAYICNICMWPYTCEKTNRTLHSHTGYKTPSTPASLISTRCCSDVVTPLPSSSQMRVERQRNTITQPRSAMGGLHGHWTKSRNTYPHRQTDDRIQDNHSYMHTHTFTFSLSHTHILQTHTHTHTHTHIRTHTPSTSSPAPCVRSDKPRATAPCCRLDIS
jgi:hypothetical protein